MKNNIRITALLTALLLLTVSFAACSGGDNNEGAVSADTSSAAETTAEETTGGYLPDGLGSDIDFGSAKVTILVRTDVYDTEFYVPEESGEVVDDAIFNRNMAIEERMGVVLEYLHTEGDANHSGVLTGAIRNSVLAADGAYDIAAVLSNQLPKLALEGLLLNLNDLPYLDFEKPWWANGLIDELAVGGRLYFASGDASLGVIRDMMCIFFNKQTAEEYALPDLYKLVSSGKWTFDLLMKYIKGTYRDLDGDGVRSGTDAYGYAFGDPNQIYGYIEAFDLRIVERDAEGYPSKLVFGSERVTDAHALLLEMTTNNPDFSVDSWNTRPYMDTFREGKILFINGQFKDTSMYREIESFDFGVIPMPKLEESQEEYGTCVRATYSSFCVPKTAKDPDMAAAVLECCASESYRKVSPAYYETALKVKYSRDDESAKVFDLIKESVKFSFGISFGYSFGDPQNSFKGTLMIDYKGWQSFYASWEPSASIKLAQTVETLRSLD